ncbi:hypothetical protein SAMN00808754_1151 [Thermanaeromonas toyohensis ToBE]|uniref:Uncharacterized protein n=1 Tax=Thermanaeromonas toyohensis ToBE TaxID=698762 RepID=A0A1W1VNJ5_9FIRM|nr:hypothetical protein [Thermanaeromonas toyohensis]SMB94955.1 hypothetical protein SAMN00808754_1151 [Thermanaeromonas toyohensis ToBE]
MGNNSNQWGAMAQVFFGKETHDYESFEKLMEAIINKLREKAGCDD